MWLEMRRADLEAEQREAQWLSFVKKLQATAAIEDSRWVYFRY